MASPDSVTSLAKTATAKMAFADEPGKQQPGDESAKDSPQVLYSVIGKLLLNDKYSDLTLHCGGQDLKVHRAIVCMQSTFSAKARDSGFLESTTQIINLPEDRPEILTLFLQFLYTGNYPDAEHPEPKTPAPEALMTLGDENASACDDEYHPEEYGEYECYEDDDEVQYDDDEEHEEQEPAEEEEENIEETEANDGEGEIDASQNHGDVNNEDSDENNSSGSVSANQPAKGNGEEAKDPHSTDAEDADDRLLTSLRVYVMADKYDVPSLKLLARERFFTRAPLAFAAYADFSAVVDELYQTTGPADHAMRMIPCCLVVARCVRDSQAIEAMELVICKHGNYGF
ncbi:hypothetical protein HIM_09259 [Hirsutella minnesotensis 3608]|uniref:BTB domain-containing protein n=1 Tax=Hirsutella minnesotensis 3608 TaxID=1043627 RepID=A0A0F7ZSG5_9HYPO|nr:hypothetical protein HIM_09259 [Hirsutella minnesotensis 3608]